MPELPELEALAEALDPLVQRAPVTGVPVLHFAVTKTFAPPLAGIVGLRMTGAGRRAKRTLLPMEDGTTVAIHLMTNGRIAWVEPGGKRPPQPVLVIAFEDGSELAVSENARRKSVRVGRYDAEGLAAELGGLGPEPLDPAFDLAATKAMLARGGQLHALLRDQRAVAGIGRAYADEILHAAQLSPFQAADRLDDAGAERLHDAIVTTLGDGIERFRAHGPRMPQKKAARALYAVHHRAGEPCPRCQSELKFIDYADHEVVYCPTCQTGGKVYADRRRSRLLK